MTTQTAQSHRRRSVCVCVYSYCTFTIFWSIFFSPPSTSLPRFSSFSKSRTRSTRSRKKLRWENNNYCVKDRRGVITKRIQNYASRRSWSWKYWTVQCIDVHELCSNWIHSKGQDIWNTPHGNIISNKRKYSGQANIQKMFSHYKDLITTSRVMTQRVVRKVADIIEKKRRGNSF